jgi:hypothetical protein
MKLHSRPGSYSESPQFKVNLWQSIEKLPQIPRIQKIDYEKSQIESYKPSSSLYRKLNARIHLRQIEFLNTIETKNNSEPQRGELPYKYYKRNAFGSSFRNTGLSYYKGSYEITRNTIKLPFGFPK